MLEKALGNAIQVGDSATLGLTHWTYGFFYYLKGDWKSTKEHLEKGLTSSQEAKYALGMAQPLFMLGYAYSYLGDPESGRRLAEKGLQVYRDTGMEFFLSVSHYVMGSMHLDSGDLENAGTSMKEALRLSRKNSEKGWEGLALVGLGRVLGKKEPRQTEKAKEYFREGLAILNDQKLKPWYSQGLMFLGEFYLDAVERKGPGKPEKGRSPVPGNGDGLLAERTQRFWGSSDEEKNNGRVEIARPFLYTFQIVILNF